MRTRSFLHARRLWLFALLVIAKAHPHNPTRILQNGSTLYVYQPLEGSSSQCELRSIDISTSITASDVPYTTLYSTLPFLDADDQYAFTPILDNGGNMTVYTGDCRAGPSAAELWTFMPDPAARAANGTWKQEELSSDQSVTQASSVGPNYLNGGIAFSVVVNGEAGDTSAYFFGGMCPSPGEDRDWQIRAKYSNLMVTLDPSKDGGVPMRYRLSVSASRGPPIPEAGFTLTGLAPSYSNRSDGSQTQQQNFVLIGGHTSAAFINMSQVALFALPQQSWIFLPVLQANRERTDLAVRANAVEVEPRSGHTTVLTPDGQRLIVFGGWIGDTDTPADPQLAILNVGEGYGGTGDWEWTVPTTSGNGLPKDTGLYGHGAAMLPGGVMMVTGGYSISSSDARSRRADSVSNTQTLFFDIGSNRWIDEYSPPKDVSSEPANPGPLASSSQKAGLGVGLGIGMAAVLTLLVFYLWYTRRLKEQRQAREKQLQELSVGAHRYTLDSLSPGPRGLYSHPVTPTYLDEPADSYFFPAAGQHNNRGWRQANGQEAERTGLLVEIPSPTRGLRRSLSARTNHHMSRYDERRVQGSGNIHPIDELEEEPEPEQSPNHGHSHATGYIPLASRPEMTERASKRQGSIFENAPVLDPFVDANRARYTGSAHTAPPVYSAPASPSHEEHLLSPGDWQPGHEAPVSRRTSLRSAGRPSPDKSDRTGSNLSERSMRSNISSNGSVARTASMRSVAMLQNANQTNPFMTPDGSPTGSKSNRHNRGGWESPEERTQSFTSMRSAGLPTAAEERDSFTTARTSFMQLQAEGEALLGGMPERPRPRTASSWTGLHPWPYHDEPDISRTGTSVLGTPAMDGSERPRKKRWLGSVRKALARSSTIATSGRTRSLTEATAQPERYTDNPKPVLNSLGKNGRRSFPSSSPPRRAVSDAGLLRSKRGKQDWLDDELDTNDRKSIWRRTSGDNWGAPEDLVLAEKERQKREWRERRSTLIDLAGDDELLPTPRTPIHPHHLGDPNHEVTLAAEDEDWDVEAAVERRVVQVMFTVPKTKLRVVNADVDQSSILSMPRDMESAVEKSSPGNINVEDATPGRGGTPPDAAVPSPSNRVKDLVDRYERASSPIRASPFGSSASQPSLKASTSPSPSPSPAASIKSMKLRVKRSERSLRKKKSFQTLPAGGASRLCSEDITDVVSSP